MNSGQKNKATNTILSVQQALICGDLTALVTALLTMSMQESQLFFARHDPVKDCMTLFLSDAVSAEDRYTLKMMMGLLAFSGASVVNALALAKSYYSRLSRNSERYQAWVREDITQLLNAPHSQMNSWVLHFNNSKQLFEFIKNYFGDMDISPYGNFLDVMKEEKRTLEDLNRYITNLDTQLYEAHPLSKKMELYPALSECACDDGMFDRSKNTRRQDIEKAILARTTEKLPPKTTPTLRYLSVGCGGMLQDFILLSKLLVSGYKEINALLVDPFINYDALTQLKMLIPFAQRQGITLTIQHCQTLDAVSHASFDLITAIDFEFFEKNFEDIIRSHQALSQRGLFFLSCREYDYCFDKQKNIANQCHMKKFNNWNNSFADAIADRAHLTTLNYASLGYDAEYEWTQILPLLNTAASNNLHFTFMQPRIRNYLHGVMPEKNTQFTPEAIHYFLKLFLPNQTITIDLVDDLASFHQIQREYDFVSYVVSHGIRINVYNSLAALLSWFYDENTFKTAYRFAGEAFSVPLYLEKVTGIKNKAIVGIIANYAGFFRQNPLETPDVVMSDNPQAKLNNL